MIPTWLRRLIGRDGSPSRPQPVAPPPAPELPPLPVTAVTRFYQQTHRRTPNISPGRTIHPTHIILHHTSGAYAGSVSWCLNPASKVSYHCIISRTGKRTVLAPPTARTWHAGVSSWQGRKNCNDFSIGLAWEGDTATTPLSEDAILSAVEYLLPLLDKFQIPLKNLIRHADVSPGRKTDCSPAAQKQLLTTLKQILRP
jgi:N-acetyl-anhydromuramyl-L-alanine amidase AmpD